MNRDSEQQVAIVTGGGSGIGAALCRRLGGRGALVAVADIDSVGADAVATEVGGMALELDVTDRSAWDQAVSTVTDGFGRLDLVALNAGVMSRPRGAPNDDEPFQWIEERYELVRSVNLDGVVYGVMAALPHLEASGGSIVCTSSGVGLRPLESDPVYSMTKHGVIGLVRSLAGPLAARGITIGAVCPGGVDTPMVSLDIRALGRSFADPDHIAGALESVLAAPMSDTGGIWISRGDQPHWRYEFAQAEAPPT
jgi:NAD(P)-dependent dehydrogenase (short-subunit alcohol dehydrogenase family)